MTRFSHCSMFYVFKADEIHKNEGSLEILASGMTGGREKGSVIIFVFSLLQLYFHFFFLSLFNGGVTGFIGYC